MGNEVLKIDQNYKGVAAGVTDDVGEDITIFRLNPVTKRLLVDSTATISGTITLGAGDNNIGNVDIVSFPAGNLGQQLAANSLSITPASNIIDATYIGDIKFAESLPTGSNTIGAVTATDLDIRNLSQSQDSVLIYGSDDGGTTKRVIKTDSGGAIQVDLEVASVTVSNGSGVNAVNIQDGGNTITVDGTVDATCSGTVSANCTQTTSPWVISGNVTSNSVNIATETTLSAINTKLVSGTDIGDVTINNASGVSAVNIQDGGNTITVDGTVNATCTATDLDIRNLAYSSDSILAYGSQNVALQQKVTSNDLIITLDGETVSTNWNGTAPPIGAGLEATALRVTMATDSTLL
jgi:hypothetical protein